MTDAQFIAWLKDSTAVRCVLVEVIVRTGGVETTRFLSNKGYVTKPTDTPANTAYSPYIVGGIKFTETLSLEGTASLSFGDIEIDNFSGDRDSWFNDVWDNRAIKVYIGDVIWARSEFRLVFDGVVSGIDTKNRGRINLRISDKLQRLNTPISENKLGGSTQNADRLKPLCFGECHNVEPLLVDPVVNEYMVHDGEIERIIEVRDNGVPVSFTPFLTTGKFRLAAQPAGQITASVQGAKKAFALGPDKVVNGNFASGSANWDLSQGSGWSIANGTATWTTGGGQYLFQNGIVEVGKRYLCTIKTLPTYATWNPSDKGVSCTLSNGNLTASSWLTNGGVRSTVGVSSGKWYWEITSTGNRFPVFGVAKSTATLASYPGNDANGWGYYGVIPAKYNNGVETAYGSTMSTSDVIGVALDMDAGTITLYKNGVSMGVMFSGLTGTVYAMTGGDSDSGGATSKTTANFGATAFAYSVPAGFNAGLYAVPSTGELLLANMGTAGANVSGTLSSGTVTFDFTSSTTQLRIWTSLSGTQIDDVTLKEVYDGTTYPLTVSQIVRRLATEYGNAGSRLAWTELDLTTFNSFDTTNPQPVGLYMKDRTNVIEAMNKLAVSVGGRVLINRSGLLTILKLTLPQASAGTTVTATDIVLQSLYVSQLPPVKAGVKIGYCKNWAVQDSNIAAGVPIDHSDLYKQEWLTITRTDSATQTNYKTFVEPAMEETLLLTNADATAEANRRLNMFNVQRKVYKYTGMPWLMLESLGASQTLKNSRFGLTNGVTGQIVSLATDWLNPHITVEILI